MLIDWLQKIAIGIFSSVTLVLILAVPALLIAFPLALIFDLRPSDVRFAAVYDDDEALPPYGMDILLTQHEVRYCVNEAVRLEALRDLARKPAVVSLLAQAVEDYNFRCARYRADPADVVLARKDAETYSGQLVAQARRTVEQWRELRASGP